MADRKVCVGVIAGPHGVRGAVRVKSFTADPRNLAAYGAVTDRAGARRFELEVTGEVRGAVLARIGGVEDRDAAETLRGTELYVERDRLPATAEDEFYHADLIGLRAEDASGAPLGAVRALHDFGGGDVMELAGPEGETRLIPFTRQAVPVVDLDAGRIVVDLPEEVEARAGIDDDGADGDGGAA